MDTDPQVVAMIIDQVDAYMDSQMIGGDNRSIEWDDNFVRLQLGGDPNFAEAMVEIVNSLAIGALDSFHRVVAGFREIGAEDEGVKAALTGAIFGGAALGYQIGRNRLDKVAS